MTPEEEIAKLKLSIDQALSLLAAEKGRRHMDAQSIIGIIVVVAFILTVQMMIVITVLVGKAVDPTVAQLVGNMGTLAGLVVGFWYGSSLGSKNAQEVIARTISAAPTVNGETSPPPVKPPPQGSPAMRSSPVAVAVLLGLGLLLTVSSGALAQEFRSQYMIGGIDPAALWVAMALLLAPPAALLLWSIWRRSVVVFVIAALLLGAGCLVASAQVLERSDGGPMYMSQLEAVIIFVGVCVLLLCCVALFYGSRWLLRGIGVLMVLLLLWPVMASAAPREALPAPQAQAVQRPNLFDRAKERVEDKAQERATSILTKPFQDLADFIKGGFDNAAALAVKIPDLQDGNGQACWQTLSAAGAVFQEHPIPLTFRAAEDLEALRLFVMVAHNVCTNLACTQVFTETRNIAAAVSPVPLLIPSLTDICAKIPPIAIAPAVAPKVAQPPTP